MPLRYWAGVSLSLGFAPNEFPVTISVLSVVGQWAPSICAGPLSPAESVHAYLLLSDDWHVSQRRPEGLTYSRRDPYRGPEICVPLNQGPGASTPSQP